MQVPLGAPSGKWLWQGYRKHRRDCPIHSGSLGRCVLFSVTMEEQPMRAQGLWSCGQWHPRPSPQVRILGGSHVLLLESRPFSDRSSIPKPQGPATGYHGVPLKGRSGGCVSNSLGLRSLVCETRGCSRGVCGPAHPEGASSTWHRGPQGPAAGTVVEAQLLCRALCETWGHHDVKNTASVLREPTFQRLGPTCDQYSGAQTALCVDTVLDVFHALAPQICTISQRAGPCYCPHGRVRRLRLSNLM